MPQNMGPVMACCGLLILTFMKPTKPGSLPGTSMLLGLHQAEAITWIILAITVVYRKSRLS